MSVVTFAYLTDTHFGCGATGYRLQARYLGLERILFAQLGRWLQVRNVDFLVHGGDLTDHGTKQEIEAVDELCGRLQLPTYACLGNHDLAQPSSMECWTRTRAWGSQQEGCIAVDAGPALVVIVSHHWHPTLSYRWIDAGPQTPRLGRRQEEVVRSLLESAAKPVIAVTHAPLHAVPIEQTGHSEPFHPPSGTYADVWQRIATAHPNLCLVLSGHNHAHSQHHHDSFISCTTAAFGEVPAQLRLITLSSDVIEVHTHTLAHELDVKYQVSDEHAWCLGPSDQHVLRIVTRTHEQSR